MANIEEETMEIVREAVRLLARVQQHKATEQEVIAHLTRIANLGRLELKQEEVLKRVAWDFSRVFGKKVR